MARSRGMSSQREGLHMMHGHDHDAALKNYIDRMLLASRASEGLTYIRLWPTMQSSAALAAVITHTCDNQSSQIRARRASHTIIHGQAVAIQSSICCKAQLQLLGHLLLWPCQGTAANLR